jgi:hypothetical protein
MMAGNTNQSIRAVLALLVLAAPAVCAGASLDEPLADLKSADAGERLAAATALRALGNEAALAAREMASFLKSDNYEVGMHIRGALIAIGKPAAPHLRAALKDSHRFSRLHALIALEELGAEAGVLEEELRPLLADEMGSVRLWACAVAAHLGVPSVELTRDLAALLDDPRAAANAEAALRRLFGRPGKAARDVAETVLRPLAAKAKGNRLALLSRLIGGAGIEVRSEQILAKYESNRAANNEWFSKTLEERKFPADKVLPVLIKELEAGMGTHDSWRLARLCIPVGMYGAQAEPAVPVLSEALRHAAEGVRRYAARAPGNIGIYLDDMTRNHVVHHNLVCQVSEALALNPPNSQGNLILNNTLDGYNVSIGMSLRRPQDMTGSRLINNIFTNRLPKEKPKMGVGKNLFCETDARFVDRPKADYQLAPDSPAVDAGVEMPPYSDGFAGRAPDLGAFERERAP